MKVSDAKIIEIQKIEDRRGNLSVVEEFKDVPFHIARAYCMMCQEVRVGEDMHTVDSNNCL